MPCALRPVPYLLLTIIFLIGKILLIKKNSFMEREILKLKIFLMLMAVVIFMSGKSSAAIEITDERATPEYWTRIDGDEIILTAQEISDLNEQMRMNDEYAADLINFPQKISATNLRNKIVKATMDVGYSINASQNLNALFDDVQVEYAVTTERVNIRLLPRGLTGERFDKLQGTALDPAEGVAVLWESADGAYNFVQARNYFGWVEKSKLAFTTREIWQEYVKPENFIVVTENKKFVEVDGKNILFQMGAVIPIDKNSDANFWNAKIPQSINGRLHEVIVKIFKDDTVHENFLPCTTNNFVRQSFKFLGDVYGWGGLKDSVDCSGFTSDIYRSMGIEIPRDADRQEFCMPIVAKMYGYGYNERVNILRRTPTGALLFKPGHVLMLLGNDAEGTPIAIHAASSYYVEDRQIYVSKVLVAALDYPNDYGVATVNALTGINYL